MTSLSPTSAGAEPFTISIPDDRLLSLQRKLALTTLPDELEHAGWAYGAPLADVARLLARWKAGFDWRAQEAALNAELPQFRRAIEVDEHGTLDVHYIHQRSTVKDAIPLLFVHGWPGGFWEARKILPLLTHAKEGQPSFHVVALSLPGFGFSEAPKKKGFGISQYAEVGHKLMLALGYNEYVTQGGDWGAAITTLIASLYGHLHSKAWHTNWKDAIQRTVFSAPLDYIRDTLTPLTPVEAAGLARTEWFRNESSGYFAEQATQPQTLGYSLADSPTGLLAWIYEKLVVWTDAYPWTDDEVLTWVSLYWFSTAGPAASLRIYYEFQHEKGAATVPRPTIPLGVSYFPKELVILPRSWIRSPYLVFESEHEKGGHFAAHEKPRELVADLRKMFGKGGPAYGVVEGHTGY